MPLNIIQRTLSSLVGLTSGRIYSKHLIYSRFVFKRHKFLDKRDKLLLDEQQKALVKHEEIFGAAAEKEKNRETFQAAINVYLKQQAKYRRGHVEFMYAAMARMKEFGVHRDIDTYRMLLDLFPKGKMVAETVWQVEFMHYPKQQQCCIDLLDKMESFGVIPDDKMGYQLIEIFGKHCHPFKKYQRMMYWMPKFKYANPYYVPWELPDDRVELAKIALQRMAVDLETKLSVYQAKELESSYDPTFIVSADTPTQKDLLSSHSTSEPLFVEGGFPVWLRQYCLTYFVLKSGVTKTYKTFNENKDKVDDVTMDFSWFIHGEQPKSMLIPPSIHEQDDGTILSMCITGTSSKDSLASWVKFLEKDNPKLSKTPVVFLLRTPESGLQLWEGEKDLDENAVIAYTHFKAASRPM